MMATPGNEAGGAGAEQDILIGFISTAESAANRHSFATLLYQSTLFHDPCCRHSL